MIEEVVSYLRWILGLETASVGSPWQGNARSELLKVPASLLWAFLVSVVLFTLFN